MPKDKKPTSRASKTAVTKKKSDTVIQQSFEEPTHQLPPSSEMQIEKVSGTNAVAIRQQYTQKELDLMKQTVAAGTSDLEFAWFLYVAKQRDLNPLTRQIHAVKRKVSYKDDDTGQWLKREVMTIQTGIDGYRTIAARSQVIPSDRPPLFEGEGTPEFRCTVYVKKWAHGAWHEIPATAYYSEFVQLTKDGNKWVPNSMWNKMPHNQLAKCAEALALRRAAPEGCGDIYVNEEMEHLDTPIVSAETEKKPSQAAKEKKSGAVSDLGSIKKSEEPNRGHDNEGMEASDRESNVLAADGDHKIARSPSGEIVPFHSGCSDCNKLLVSYMKQHKGEKHETQTSSQAETSQQTESTTAAAESKKPGSGRRASSREHPSCRLVKITNGKTSRDAEFLLLEFDDEQLRAKKSTIKIFNFHKSLFLACTAALNKECSILFTIENEDDAEKRRIVLDDIVRIGDQTWEQGKRVNGGAE